VGGAHGLRDRVQLAHALGGGGPAEIRFDGLTIHGTTSTDGVARAAYG
jgi:hypothetical protein